MLPARAGWFWLSGRGRASRPVATTGRTEARTKAWLLLPLLAVFAVLAFPATASAANTIVVDTTADNTPTGCSLRAAILAASTDHTQAGCTSGAPGADTIQVPAGTYDLSANFGQLVVSSDMNIIGAGARATDIRGYALGSRLLEISAGTVTIRGFTIEGGNETNGSPLPNPGVGGGIWIDNPGSLTLQDSMVLGNHADQSGGGIDNDGTLAVIGSTIEHNTAGCGVISCGFGV